MMRKTVMIIDDQESTRSFLKHYLSNFYNVIEKTSAVEALGSLTVEQQVDAIVLDIMMPGMTGIEFLTALQKKQPGQAVIMLTSIENSTEKLKCFHFGARDYITKPFNPEELRVRLNNLLN